MKTKICILAGGILLLASAAAEQPEKTAGESMKNVQLLKDVPVSEWEDTMTFMDNSLGVRCFHCHTLLEYEKDDLKPKQTARAMIQMTRELNAKNFGGRSEITCNTCHRGALHPNGTPGLNKTPDVAAAQKTPPAAKTAADAPPLPDADQVLAAYHKAVGGDGVKALRMKAALTSGVTPPFDAEIDISLPDKLAQHVVFSGQDIRQILNGNRGWAVAPGRRLELTPANMASSRRTFEILQPVKFFLAAGPHKTTGVEKIGDRSYTVVESQRDKHLERLYFDTETGLLFKRRIENQTVLGTTVSEITFEDYRDVTGVKMPYVVTTITPIDRAQYKFSEIHLNVPIDPSKFDAPPPLEQK